MCDVMCDVGEGEGGLERFRENPRKTSARMELSVGLDHVCEETQSRLPLSLSWD